MMEPITSWAVGTVAEKLLGKFTSGVIAKWTRRRAEEFLRTFLQEFESEQKSGDRSATLDGLLEQMANDEEKSEALFDAYRTVAFARSSVLGPRIIGLLTAKLVLAGRTATDQEGSVFRMAEMATDQELRDSVDFIDRCRAKEADDHEDYRSDATGNLTIRWSSEVLDSNWRGDSVPLGPLSPYHDLGPWAMRLEQAGILRHDVTDRTWDYDEDSERHVDEPGTATQRTWRIYLAPSAGLLRDLVTRAVTDGC